MKPPTITTILCTTGSFLALAFYGCNNSTNSNLKEPELMTLDFTRTSYAPGQALVLRATPNSDLNKEFFKKHSLNVKLTTSNGEDTSAQMSPWSDLTDEEMVEAIKDGLGRALLRIKETDKKSARNSEGELVAGHPRSAKFPKLCGSEY